MKVFRLLFSKWVTLFASQLHPQSRGDELPTSRTGLLGITHEGNGLEKVYIFWENMKTTHLCTYTADPQRQRQKYKHKHRWTGLGTISNRNNVGGHRKDMTTDCGTIGGSLSLPPIPIPRILCLTVATLAAISGTQPWQSNVLFRPSQWYIWLSPVKDSI